MKKLALIALLLPLAFGACKKDTNPAPPSAPGTQPGEVVITSDIVENTTWTSDNTYLIKGSIRIKENSTLTIEPGTVIRFDPLAGLFIFYNSLISESSRIVAKGTADKPITFTSSLSNPSPGAWGGIYFLGEHTFITDPNSILEHCVIEYAGESFDAGVLITAMNNVEIRNCTFRKIKGVAFEELGLGMAAFENNTLESSTTSAIKVSSMGAAVIGNGNSFESGKRIEVEGALRYPGTHTWKDHGVPYYVTDGIDIGGSSEVRLNIDPGVRIEFDELGELNIGNGGIGSINVSGGGNQVLFTKSDDNSIGYWGGVIFYDQAETSVLDNCMIAFGGYYGSTGANVFFKDDVASGVTVKNCLLSDSKQYGIAISLSGFAKPALSNNTFSNNVKGDTNW